MELEELTEKQIELSGSLGKEVNGRLCETRDLFPFPTICCALSPLSFGLNVATQRKDKAQSKECQNNDYSNERTRAPVHICGRSVIG